MITTPTQSWMTIQDKSQEFRWLVKDGEAPVLQIACPYMNENGGGFEWRNIPVVREERHGIK